VAWIFYTGVHRRTFPANLGLTAALMLNKISNTESFEARKNLALTCRHVARFRPVRCRGVVPTDCASAFDGVAVSERGLSQCGEECAHSSRHQRLPLRVTRLSEVRRMKTLEQIFTDHNGKAVDKWASYIQEYEGLFARFRNEPITLLEVGVQNGGSLEIWDNYFLRAKAIVGCDIDPACEALQFNSDRIHVVIGDATTQQCARQVAAVAPNFDIIIDDGSHVAKDVIGTFSRYFSTLKSNGLYIIEDLHCSYWRDCEGRLAYPSSAVSFLKALTDILNCDHWGISRQRREFLIKYSQRYGLDFDEDVLADIHSITFLNSLSLIQKADQTRKNAPGSRRIMGREAAVNDATLPLAGQDLVSPDQGSEP
jgi:O-antigen biosynthesis protein